MVKTILIVDDEPNNLQVLRAILISTDYKLVFANNGEQALIAVKKHQPNLILLDIMMPGMSGYEVCRQLKNESQTASIPIIFVTAKGEVEDEAKGFDLGAIDYITKPVSPPIVKRRIATHLSLVKIDELNDLARASVIMLGEAGHFNDTDTGNHIWRMAAYAKALATAAGWSEEQVNMLELAAPMHDTGKIGIPDNILKAPRKLTAEEWIIMKTHAQIGADILANSKNPTFQLASIIAKDHHEKWDGSGYPRGLKGEEINEAARIVAITDVFDALTMKRPYKEPWSIEDSLLELIKGKGEHFDGRLVDLFIGIEDKIRVLKSLFDD